MRPLDIAVIAGKEDERLLQHISTLEHMKRTPPGLTGREHDTLIRLYQRLELITRPNTRFQPS